MDTINSQSGLGLREFKFGDFLSSARRGFVGRQWLFRQIEDTFDLKQGTSGILITGDPGSGKSALVSEMICSKHSSPMIHSRILGFHFCSNSDKGTQNAAKFVRNLANMIAVKIKQYKYVISSDPFIQKLLHIDCFQDPVGCFDQSILTPLNEMDIYVSREWYVIIDALDECVTCSSSSEGNIVSIIKSKILRFPKWLRLILTSRKEPSITKYLKGIHTIEIEPDNPRNQEDITAFINKKLSHSSFSVSSLATILRMEEPKSLEKITLDLAEKSQGNFLYIKMLFYNIQIDDASVDILLLPPSLSSTYQTFFERQYPQGTNFKFVRKILEVLIASFKPLTTRELFTIISQDEKGLHFKYDFLPKLKELSIFLRESKDEGIVSIYHSSLAEWLTSKGNEGELYFVDREMGHRLLAKYHLMQANSSTEYLNADSTFYLATHIIEGGTNSGQLKSFLSFPSEFVNKSDTTMKVTSLHSSAALGTPEVTSLLEKHFFQVDIEDSEGRTPAFRAASHGNVKNLDILVKRGANINHVSAPLDKDTLLYSDDPLEDCKRTMCEYSLLHAAAQGGHTETVIYLLDKGVNHDKKTTFGYNALHLAAEQGHTETVKTLLKYNMIADAFALNQAAENGYVEVVKQIISRGVTDMCENNMFDRVKFEYFRDPLNANDNPNEFVNQRRKMQRHETALNSAIKHEHNNVVKTLLNETVNTANCINRAGFYPLHVAVVSYNIEATRLLLGAGVYPTTRCQFIGHLPFRMSHDGGNYDNPSLVCRCGFTALHWAAELQYYDIAVELINFGIDTNARDCNGSTALHIASCHGNPHFLQLLVNSSRELINARTNNGSTPLHSAANCHASGAFETLLKLGSDPYLKDNEGMNAIHYILKDVFFTPELYFLDPYVRKPWQSLTFDFSKDSMLYKVMDSYPWYKSLITLIMVMQSQSRKVLFGSNEAELDIMAFAGARGLDNASVLLTEEPNRTHYTHVASLTPIFSAFDLSFRLFLEFHFHKNSLPVKINVFSYPIAKIISKLLLSLQNRNCSILTLLFSARTPYAASLLLEFGFDINCPSTEIEERPLFKYLHVGGRHLSKLLVQFNADIKVECGKRFHFSPLHLVAYHKLHYLNYLSLFYPGDQWEEYIESKNAIFDHFFYEYKETTENGEVLIEENGDGPAVKAIKKHPRGTKIIDECLDEDGFTLLHRAAQGANFAAVRKLLSLGADVSITTPQGASALVISVDYAVKTKPLNFFNSRKHNVLMSLEIEFASLTASALLDHLTLSNYLNIGCEEESVDITLYHLAASRGMWKFVKKLFQNKQITGINANCTNRHGLTPLYLAKIHASSNWDSPWCKVINVIEAHGGAMSYPNLETEYNIIFKFLFDIIPESFDLDLSDDDVRSLQAVCGAEECNSYKNEATDYLSLSDKIDSVLRRYELQINALKDKDVPERERERERERLFELAGAEPALRLFSYTFMPLHVRFYRHRAQVIKFFEGFRLELGKVFASVTNEDPGECVPAKEMSSNRYEDINMCGKTQNGREIDIDTALKNIYQKFRTNLDILSAHSDEAKKYVSTYDNGKRELWEVYHVLYKHDAGLRCDLQSITKKYVHLKFLLHALENWKLGIHSTTKLPNVSRFLADRINKILIEEPSEAMFDFIIGMSLKKSPPDFSYLQALKNRKPPL